MPQAARTPCSLALTPARPTAADLEALALLRGAALVECDGRRELAVATHDAEHRLQEEQAALRARRARPWWRIF